MKCGFSKHFSRAWVLYLGYEPSKSQSKVFMRPKRRFWKDEQKIRCGFSTFQGRESCFFLLPKSLFGEHKDDDSTPMCLSNSQDDDSTPMCLSNSQHDDSMPMCLLTRVKFGVGNNISETYPRRMGQGLNDAPCILISCLACPIRRG